MTVFFYDTILFCYRLAIIFLSPFDKKAKQWVTGRKNIFGKIESALNLKSQIVNLKSPIVWFHCASLGEFEQGRPVMEEFRQQYPGYKILVTFFSPSGYEMQKNYKGADYVFYLPFDTPKNAKRFIAMVRPLAAFFIKYEFWYHYLVELQKNNIPVFVVSAIFRKNQFFFKWYGKWFREVLKKITVIFTQTQQSVLLLHSIGCNNGVYSGDTRFDRVLQVVKNQKIFPVVQKFVAQKNGSSQGNAPVLMAGSTWPEDEYFLVNFINHSVAGGANQELFGKIKFIIVPHEIEESHIQNLMANLKAKAVRFSETKEDDLQDAKVLIIDAMGMLSSLYQYADIVYVGGGFGKGIHNILEAAAWGKPVIFGPNYEKFEEAVQLSEKSGAFPVTNYRELEDRIRFLVQNDLICKMAALLCKNYVRQNSGATQRVLCKVKEYIS